MNHSGDANKMVSDTPRTDEAYFKDCATMYDLAGEMKRMERELNAANERIELLTACNADVARIAKERDDALERIKRLEEAGDEMARWLSSPRNIGGDRLMAAEWDKAKEAKP